MHSISRNGASLRFEVRDNARLIAGTVIGTMQGFLRIIGISHQQLAKERSLRSMQATPLRTISIDWLPMRLFRWRLGFVLMVVCGLA
jgi:hypothetical protein